MPARKNYKTPKSEQGLVLLVLVIIIVLASVTYSFSGISITQVHVDQSKKTAVALKQAKQALINYAVTYSDRTSGSFYGFLPYPEVSLFGDEDGNTATTITGSLKDTNVIGWLPWRELDIENLKDESGSCLFYAVSGTYKFGASVKADMVNEDSIGMFQVVDDSDPVKIIQGKKVEDRIVALVIAPGEALAGQLRKPTEILSSCGRDYDNVSAYLEGDGTTDNSFVSLDKDQIDSFIPATETYSADIPRYNDKFLTITRDEIWNAIVKRDDFKKDMESLTRALATCAANYANHALNKGRRLPWATKINLGSSLSYRDNISYDDDPASEGYSGRYPFIVANSNAAIDPVNMLEDSLFEIPGLCGGSDLGNDWQGVAMNLADNSSKYRQLWNNWKDHFFYILSKSYEPENTSTKANCEDGVAACVQVNTTKYAGAVIFSGSRLASQNRVDKFIISEYLENGKAAVFADEVVNKTGAETYVYTDPDAEPDTVNDIMYCIENNTLGTSLNVSECLWI